MDAMAQIRVTFFQECEEQLAEVESGLIAMNDGAHDTETVNAVFRAVHSIKGGAGAFKLNELVSFAHVFETVLDQIRSSRLEPDADVLRVMLRSADVLQDLVKLSQSGDHIDDSLWSGLAGELERLVNQGAPPAEAAGPADDTDFGFEVAMISLDDFGGGTPPADPRRRFDIVFKPLPALYEKASEPVILLRELSKLGELAVTCDTSGLPDLDEMTPRGAYFSWRITLTTEASEADVREVFEFVDGDCELTIVDAGPVADVEGTAFGGFAGLASAADEAAVPPATSAPAAPLLPSPVAAEPTPGPAMTAAPPSRDPAPAPAATPAEAPAAIHHPEPAKDATAAPAAATQQQAASISIASTGSSTSSASS